MPGTSELQSALQRRQERCEKDGSVFENKAIVSSSDVAWCDHTANQFTPRDVRDKRGASGSPERPSRFAERGRPVQDAVQPVPEASTEEDESCSESASDAAGEEEALRRRLQLEREVAREMEQRALEAEQVAVWLKEELDLRSGRSERPAPRDAMQDTGGVEHTRVVRREAPRQDPEEIREVLALREELHKLNTHAAKKRDEVMHLTQRNGEMSRELQEERQRVRELRRVEAAHDADLGKVGDSLKLNQRLQDELKYLREEARGLKESISRFRGHEQSLKEEINELHRSKSGSDDCNPEEMERLSMTVGGQLVSVERELAAKTREVSDLAEPFVRQMHALFDAARKACQRLDSGSRGGQPRRVPGLFDPVSRDLHATLRAMLELLHYFVEVLSREHGGESSRGGAADGEDPFGHSVRSTSFGASSHSPSRKGGKGEGRTKSTRPRDEPSGWSKRWTCMLAE